jgi:hypothetical protein
LHFVRNLMATSVLPLKTNCWWVVRTKPWSVVLLFQLTNISIHHLSRHCLPSSMVSCQASQILQPCDLITAIK